MRKPKNSEVAMTMVKKEIIEIDSDTDEVNGRMLALSGQVNGSYDLLNTLAEYGETNRTSMQIVCANDFDSGLDYDLDYKKYLESCSENGYPYLLEDNARDSSPMRLMYNVDDKASDRSRAGRRSKSPMNSRVSKKLKTDNGRADHKSISRTIFRTKETQQKKGDARQGTKSTMTKNNVVLKPTSYVKDTQQKKEDVRRGRKPTSYVKKNLHYKFKACEKAIDESRAGRNGKSQTILSASRRLKTENGRADHSSISRTITVINTKDIEQKKRKAPWGRKIHVTKHNVESKSTSHVKTCKKDKEESLLRIDKSYAYYVAYLRNSIESDVQVKPVKDLVCLSDCDIIAISDQPFGDGDDSPFEANKDNKVIDVEDDVEPENRFNTLFSKKLMEIVRKPYDKKEYLKLYKEVSVKKPLTRSRQLRDGREIEYNVEELALSYLERYPDFKKKLSRLGKDRPRALNLLRGFFIYMENIVLEGAFKPWLYEKHLMNFAGDSFEGTKTQIL